MPELTPMMQQYMETKKQVPDCILFYRLGDFYEMFFEDAELASRELELTLTGKSCGLPERAPMCGVPFHACDTYLERLIEKGYRVAICEQVEDPKEAKGLVRREVIRIVSQGTNIATATLDEDRNNYICCAVSAPSGAIALCACDVLTGDFFVSNLAPDAKLIEELYRIGPSEVILNKTLYEDEDLAASLKAIDILVTAGDNSLFDAASAVDTLKEHFKAYSTKAMGIDEDSLCAICAGALLKHLIYTQKNDLSHITSIRLNSSDDKMILDRATLRNLELSQTMREKKKKGSLLGILDRTKTAMGARLMRKSVTEPLTDIKRINRRLDGISEFLRDMITREELREYLNCVYDMERLLGKVIYGSANPRDLNAFAGSLKYIPDIKKQLSGFESELICEINNDMDPLDDIYSLIVTAIKEDPPVSVREGGIINDGYSERIDEYRRASTEGKVWLTQVEDEEREKTGIKNLRIKYNKVFGYFLEVTNSYLDLVPDYFVRKQTLTGSERFVTPRLKELEDMILGANDHLTTLEYDTYMQVVARIKDGAKRIRSTADALARLDVACSLAYVAEKNRYVRPVVTNEDVIDIKGGRHPVVERMEGGELFVENDACLDNDRNRIAIITGPNMAGKSTYMRQTALITLMAQMGSYVPASEALIGICDRIFTRVGASDDLSSGQSTFMLEMTEVANILRNATSRSLIILDEIGRGTSTYDGLSIAWAVAEYISRTKERCAKTMFATHYHEMTMLENVLPNVKNYNILVKETATGIVFLRKIAQGGADRSYGIQVAELAGVPDVVTKRARDILSGIISDKEKTADTTQSLMDISRAYEAPCGKSVVDNEDITDRDSASGNELSLEAFAIADKIKNADLSRMTPLEAISFLYELQDGLTR